MTRNKREMLILFGILAVLAVILYVRSRPPEVAPGQQAAQQAAGGAPGDARPGVDTPVAGGTDPPGSEAPLMQRYPLELLAPSLSDSAVARRIAAGPLPDPFASDRGRGRGTPTRQTVTRPPPRQREATVIQLESWPAGVNYEGLFEDATSPGTWNVLFNEDVVRVGGRIPRTREGEEWILVDANASLIRIRWTDPAGNTVREYLYVVP